MCTDVFETMLRDIVLFDSENTGTCGDTLCSSASFEASINTLSTGWRYFRTDPHDFLTLDFNEKEEVSDPYEKCCVVEDFLSKTSDVCIDPRYFYDDVCDIAESAEINPVASENEKEINACFQVAKPTISYAQMITQAIKTSNTGKLTLNEIYMWIENNFEYYKYTNPAWKNSIRHNLSLNKCFKRVPREAGIRGKGGRWEIDYDFLTREEQRRKGRKICKVDYIEIKLSGSHVMENNNVVIGFNKPE